MVRIKKLHVILLALVVLASLVVMATPAASQSDECLRVAGVEAGGELLNLDPINQPNTQNSIMVGVVYNRLMDLDSDFVTSPELAESWESNEDATVWTFHLRDDVTFHSGKPFTAADVRSETSSFS